MWKVYYQTTAYLYNLMQCAVAPLAWLVALPSNSTMSLLLRIGHYKAIFT